MEISQEDYLQHHGVKGMHWGFRQSKKKAGVSRAGGATIDRNNRHAQVIKDERSGKRHKVAVALGRKVLGEQQQKTNWNTMLKNINQQNQRIRSGKATIHDKLQIYGQTSLSGLVISRTPA